MQKIPPKVKEILRIFNTAKPDSIRLVGGCVRDLLLGKNVSDFDFATTFLPEQTIEIMQKNQIQAIPTGIKYGTITAVIDKENFEITTLRKDVENDGRHPKTEFVDDYYFDAARRDFTINALYLDEKGEIFDYFDGLNDLKKQRVRFIGDANQRIQEDYLRILRFFRFSSIYAENIDEIGLKSCLDNKNGLKKLSSERIHDEIYKFLRPNEPSLLIKLIKTLILINKVNKEEQVFAAKLDISAFENLITAKTSAKLKLASLIISPQNNLENIAKTLNFSNFEKKYYHFLQKNLGNQNYQKLLCFYQKDFVSDLCLLNHAKTGSDPKADLDFIKHLKIPNFPLNGQDLLDLGFSGAKIGEKLAQAKEFWIENNFKPTKNQLLSIIEKPPESTK